METLTQFGIDIHIAYNANNLEDSYEMRRRRGNL